MATSAIGLNRTFPIKNADGTSFHDLVMYKATVDSVVMSLGDKITGEVYYRDNTLSVTMQEYVEYEGVKYYLVNPPTIVREGMVSDNGTLKGMTKYAFEFYHPMYMLGNFPFTDVAVTASEERYLSQNKTFSWIGTLFDFIAKLNANLASTEWYVVANIAHYEQDGTTVTSQWQKASTMSEVMAFDKKFISEALKDAYDQWEIPFVISSTNQTVGGVQKKYLIEFGLPTQEVYGANGVTPYVFRFGKGVGLKNNSRTPKNNKIVTRIAGFGAERNVPYGYPQIVWEGNQEWNYTINNTSGMQEITVGGQTILAMSYPIYNGIVGGQNVRLIKHPFTRSTLMPSIYTETVNRKVNPYATGYNPNGQIIDYYDATAADNYPNPIVAESPSYESHQFEDIYPRLNSAVLTGVQPYEEVESEYITEQAFRDYITSVINSAAPTEQSHIQAMMTAYGQGVSQGTDAHAMNVGGAYTYDWSLTFKGDFCKVHYASPTFNYDATVLLAGHTPTVVWDDTMDDDGNYVQSYFKVTLPPLGFDLYACAAITEEMQINMRSGACLGCTFPIQVDWDDYKANFYDSDGNFDPAIGNGHPRNATKYPNSTGQSITVIVKKEIETFGTLMPNIYQQPATGDEFVFLGISLPLSYITSAEQELDDAMKEYMLENNVYYYDYPLKFDEHFLATHTDILSQIHNNSIIRFQFASEPTMALYVKQITVKYGDKPLPQYDITLTDDVEIVLNQIGQTTDDVSRLRVQVSELQKYYSGNLIDAINERLSRTVDDVALGRITFQQGLDAIGTAIFNDKIQSSGFVSGMDTNGRGWRIDELGNAELESLRVRSYLEVIELLVNRLQAQEGDTLFTDNDQIDKVDITYIAATPQSNDSPKAKYWYEVVDGEYVMTTDVSVVSSKTYYKAYYTLSLKEKWSGYFTSQKVGNILKGIVNTLAAMYGNVSDITEAQSVENDGANKFYTSWMVVVDPLDAGIQSISNNQIVVRLWEDNEGGDYDVSPQNTKGVPAGKNFIPCELMCIARWGCLDPIGNESSDLIADIRSRQQMFYISAKEGRIAKLTRVCQPILYEWNYGTTLGILPDFVRQWSIGSRLVDGRDYLYAQGVVVQDFIKVDYQGAPIVNYVDEGEWQNGTPYLHNAYNSNNMQWETSDVWHNGSYWRCRVTQPYNGVYYEPTDANSTYWQKLMSGSQGTSVIIQDRAVTTNVLSPNWQRDVLDGGIVLLFNHTYDYAEWNDEDEEWNYYNASIGDCYIVNEDKHLYEMKSDGWYDLGKFEGDDGQNGRNGTDGVDGVDGVDGADGEDALLLTLDTYSIAFPTDSNGAVESALTYNVSAKMFLGNNAQQTITSLTATSSDGDVDTSGTSPANGVKITIDESSFVNTIRITVTATCAKGSRTATINLTPTPKGAKGDDGQDGQDGQDGARGKIGRFFYYAQEWQSTSKSYIVSDAQAPFFSYNNQYWVFNPETNGTYTMAQMGAPSNSNPNWQIMTNDFKYLITEAIFADNAKLGSAIFSGDWMISQVGKADGQMRTASAVMTGYLVGSSSMFSIKPYTLFDPYHPLDDLVSLNTYTTTIASSETAHNVIALSQRSVGLMYKVTCRVTDGTTFSGENLRLQIDKNGVYDPITLLTISEEETDYTAYFMVPVTTTYRLRLVRNNTTFQADKITTIVEQVTFAPQYAVDLLTGKSYMGNAYVKGTVVQPSLVINDNNYSDYEEVENTNSYLQLSDVTATNIYIYYFPLSSSKSYVYVALPKITSDMVGKEITICNATVATGSYPDMALELRIASHGTIGQYGVTVDTNNPNGLLVTMLCHSIQWGGNIPSYRTEVNALEVPSQHEVRLRAANEKMWVAVGAPYSIIGE